MPRTMPIDAPTGTGRSSLMPAIASCVSSASHAASEAARVGFAAEPGDGARLDGRSSRPSACRACRRCRRASSRELLERALGERRRRSTPSRCERHDRHVPHLARPVDGATAARDGGGAVARRARASSDAGRASGARALRPSRLLRAERHRGLRALLRRAAARRRRSAAARSLAGARALARHELRDASPRASPRRRAPACASSARAIAAASSRPVWKRSSRVGASARITIASSSGGRSRTYVLGGSTTPERTMSRSASPPSPPWSGRPVRHLPEDDAERVEVAPPVDLLAARLLGRHVAELALEDARSSPKSSRARDAEVGDLHGAFEREEDVLRARRRGGRCRAARPPSSFFSCA